MVRVPIIEDRLLEPAEQFHANLALVDSNGISVTVDPPLSTVNIISDDSELGIFWGEESETRKYREQLRKKAGGGKASEKQILILLSLLFVQR